MPSKLSGESAFFPGIWRQRDPSGERGPDSGFKKLPSGVYGTDASLYGQGGIRVGLAEWFGRQFSVVHGFAESALSDRRSFSSVLFFLLFLQKPVPFEIWAWLQFDIGDAGGSGDLPEAFRKRRASSGDTFVFALWHLCYEKAMEGGMDNGSFAAFCFGSDREYPEMGGLSGLSSGHFGKRSIFPSV